MLIRNLASDETGIWRIVFKPDYRSLYVEFVMSGPGRRRRLRMNSHEFLRVLPVKGELHQQAMDEFVKLISGLFDPAADRN